MKNKQNAWSDGEINIVDMPETFELEDRSHWYDY